MMRALARFAPRTCTRPAWSGKVAATSTAGGNTTCTSNALRAGAGTAAASAAATATATAAAAGLLLAVAASSTASVEGYGPSRPAPAATAWHSRGRMAVRNRWGAGVALCESSPVAFDPSSHHDDDGHDDDHHMMYERVHPPDRSQTESHALFGPLLGEGKIERYHFYRRVHPRRPPPPPPVVDDGGARRQPTRNGDSDSGGDSDSVTGDSAAPIEVAVGDVQLGNQVNGHEGIVHGGIISLLLDDAMGWGYEALLRSDPDLDADPPTKIVTANLNIDYRAPLMQDSRAVVRVYYVRNEGRKIYFQARLESHDGETLYAEATSLFVKLKKE